MKKLFTIFIENENSTLEISLVERFDYYRSWAVVDFKTKQVIAGDQLVGIDVNSINKSSDDITAIAEQLVGKVVMSSTFEYVAHQIGNNHDFT